MGRFGMIPGSPVVGCILGTAVGDALGLPYEGLGPHRGRRLFGPPDRFHLLAGRGMVSDDTEHACLVAQALVASAARPEHFARQLSLGLKGWFLAFPPGIGFATLRALVKLTAGVPPDRSGVWSAGNGPAMRSAVLGAAIDDLASLRDLVHRSTIMTHRDSRAESGAWAVALAAHHARNHSPIDPGVYLRDLRASLPESANTLLALIERALDSARKQPVTQFALSLGLERGVTGFIDDTVPVAICAWLRCPSDLMAALAEVIRCGGDTDSVGAIVGGIIGAGNGKQIIPPHFLQNLVEWPRTVTWMERLGEQLDRVMKSGHAETPLDVSYPAMAVRNLMFLVLVLAHGLRRALPPY